MRSCMILSLPYGWLYSDGELNFAIVIARPAEIFVLILEGTNIYLNRSEKVYQPFGFLL